MRGASREVERSTRMLIRNKNITMNDLNNSSATGQTGLMMSKNAPPAFHILSKPTGAIWNLDGKYCTRSEHGVCICLGEWAMDKALQRKCQSIVETQPATASAESRWTRLCPPST